MGDPQEPSRDPLDDLERQFTPWYQRLGRPTPNRQPTWPARHDGVALTRPITWRFILAGVLVLTVLAGWRAIAGHPPPDLQADCTTAAIAVRPDSGVPGTAVRWAASGPETDLFAVAIGGGNPVRGADGQWRIGKGETLAENVEGVAAPFHPSDCKAGGVFGIRLHPGKYSVTLYRLSDDGTSVAVAEAPLTVDGP